MEDEEDEETGSAYGKGEGQLQDLIVEDQKNSRKRYKEEEEIRRSWKRWRVRNTRKIRRKNEEEEEVIVTPKIGFESFLVIHDR